MGVTATVEKALRFILARGGCTSGELAGEMWPDSPAWNKVKQQGNYGAARGSAMFRPALGLLGKLAKAGLVQHDFRRNSIWVVTDQGRQAIAS